MSRPSTVPNPDRAAWRMVLASTLSSAWDSVFLGIVFGFIYAGTGPETEQPSGWPPALIIAGCWIGGGGLAGFCVGVWRVCHPSPPARSRAEP